MKIRDAYLIPLTSGEITIVDADQYDTLSAFNWSNGDYAIRFVRNSKETVYMHRQIIGVRDSDFVNHRNGDRLDNRIANLRICDYNKIYQSALKRNGCASRYKGVTPHRGKWQAEITTHKLIYLGCYKTEKEAALAYDKAAIEFFGEYATLNFSQEGYMSLEDIERAKQKHNELREEYNNRYRR